MAEAKEYEVIRDFTEITDDWWGTELTEEERKTHNLVLVEFNGKYSVLKATKKVAEKLMRRGFVSETQEYIDYCKWKDDWNKRFDAFKRSVDPDKNRAYLSEGLNKYYDEYDKKPKPKLQIVISSRYAP